MKQKNCKTLIGCENNQPEAAKVLSIQTHVLNYSPSFFL